MSSPKLTSLKSASQLSLTTLFAIFAAWKLLIIFIAYASPGIGYDTSTSLLDATVDAPAQIADVPSSLISSTLKLVRWDGIYFMRISQRGHVFEQEWAFGKGVSTVLSTVVKTLSFSVDNNIVLYATTGAVLSHLAHWGSVVALYLTAKLLQDPLRPASSAIPFIAAALHVISPAGIFLSAPNAESLFSFLNMFGFYFYTRSKVSSGQSMTATNLTCKLAAGISFGLATTVRGNGILSGIPFLLDAIDISLDLISPQIDLFSKSPLLLQLQLTVLAGCCVAFGMIWPQFLAYREYCIIGSGERAWCNSWFPSIFSYVQSHYWNVGFLRYWTLSNLPLFVLAMPCLYLLSVSGINGVRPSLSRLSATLPFEKLRLRIALPQLILALLALTSYHVQIITRQASGYPFWYIWLATKIDSWKHWNVTVRVLTIYALIQAGLFACFLPPA